MWEEVTVAPTHHDITGRSANAPRVQGAEEPEVKKFRCSVQEGRKEGKKEI